MHNILVKQKIAVEFL